MSLLEAIKGPKTLSFKHWRYRLLHWCFGINPSSPSDSDLPLFMYTHYCPLFHVTNMIALFSPIILMIRFVMFSTKTAAFVCVAIATPIVNGYVALWKALTINLPEKKERKPRPLTDLQKFDLDCSLIYQQVMEGCSSFDYFWHRHGAKMMLMEHSEAETYFTSLVEQVEAERERKAASEKAWREFFAQMVVVSRVVIKTLLYILYAGFAVGLVAGVYYGTMPFLSLLHSIGQWIGDSLSHFFGLLGNTFTTEFVTMILAWAGAFLGIFVTIILTALTAFKLRLGSMIMRGSEAIGQAMYPYVKVFTRVISWPFVKLQKFCVDVKDFIGMFYEENCPAITIVEED